MKKGLLIFVALIGFCFISNAQGPAFQIGANLNLNCQLSVPDAQYYIKIVKNGDVAYAKVSGCQIALEKAYDALYYYDADEVRIVSEYTTMNGSCRNRTYTYADLDDLRRRRDS